MLAIAGLVVSSFIGSNRSSDQPGVQGSDFPGTTPPEGDTASGGQGQAVDGMPCERGEQLAFHVHAHLFILRDGLSQTVPANIGIHGGALLPRCIYWLHTHDRTGVIHIEAPVQRAFTLGQLFDIWGQPLSPSQVALQSVPAGQLEVFVDGRPFSGDPRAIELKAHTQVVIEVGKQVKPPGYDFQGS